VPHSTETVPAVISETKFKPPSLAPDPG